MQSEAGAAGAVHGALTGGALCTTYTASQGLLLMIPNMYKIAGELMPCVFHVAARAIAAQALSIYGEHSDIMAVRSTGFALLSSHSVQEAHDLALVSHIATLNSSVPFVHFFDGFRTSHEIQKVNLMKYEEIAKLIPMDKIMEHRNRGANPEHPHLRGTAQTPDIFFQLSERCNPYYEKVADIVDETFENLKVVLGKRYKLFEYYGAKDATDCVVVMGSGSEVMEEVVDYLNGKGSKVGVLKIHLFRPWSVKHFFQDLPKSIKRIAVLDRCKDVTAMGEPLFLDVATTFSINPPFKLDLLVGGRYGLGSKDFTPGMGISVFQNLKSPNPILRFTVGIIDDVTHTSLPIIPEPDTLPADMSQCIFWGLGSDGTVGANKDAIKIIGDHTDLTIQAYFAYDAKKSGGITQSYLRFGTTPIKSPYLVRRANYIAVHKTNFVKNFEVIESIREGGTFVLNSTWDSLEEMEPNLPSRLKKQIAEKNVKFYNINAIKVGKLTGLGKRVNQVLQTVFFYLSKVIPFEKATEYMKLAIKKTYGRKGDAVVNMNYQAVDKAIENLVEIKYPESWKNLNPNDDFVDDSKYPEFVRKVMIPIGNQNGDKLPVSVFTPGGLFPAGTTKYEKRGIALTVPEWISGNCTQCNKCATVCPHAAIRAFLADDEESKKAPNSYVTIKSTAVSTMKFRIQVSPYDCTGCELCVRACDDDALKMMDIDYMIETQKENWEYSVDLSAKGDLVVRNTQKGSQFFQPLLEFSGACEGCGETPYVKLMTQLFGERMIISNATGCSSIWGGIASFNPYTVNEKGQGPSWANSLFEDNAEYGLGIKIAGVRRRELHLIKVQNILENKDVKMSQELRSLLSDWILNFDDGTVCQKISDKIQILIEKEKNNHPMLLDIYNSKDQFPRISMWIVGGDGWAYDIGYGGVDHVLASGEDVNIVVLDTEMYSNTGGQCSKSTQFGAVAKFSANGKRLHKKEMAQMAMSYGNVYVASVCLYSNMTQVVKAFSEAESYPGPSIIFAYSPCISMGLSPGMSASWSEAQAAVDSGYWPLYRWDPRLVDQHMNPFQLDSKKLRSDLSDFLSKEVRFQSLMQKDPKLATTLQVELKKHLKERHQFFVNKSTMNPNDSTSAPKSSGTSLTILYGSETGNAESVAKMMYDDAVVRNLNVTLSECDDYDASGLPSETNLVIVCSTAGQGDLPKNAREFYSLLCKLSENSLSMVNYAVFGLGDTNYKFFNEAAKKFDKALSSAGAKRFGNVGMGNDHDEDGYMTAYIDWEIMLWDTLKATYIPPTTPNPPKYNISVLQNTASPSNIRRPTSNCIQLTRKDVVTPKDYDRYMMHLEFNIKDTGLRYVAGNALAIYGHNDGIEVDEFLNYMNFNGDDVISIKPVDMRLAGVFPNVCSVKQLFTERLDVFGKPTRKFYESLLVHVANPEEKNNLIQLLSPSGKDAMSALIKDTVTYADIIKKFPSCKPSLAHVIELIPQIKPRFYSIASSPIMHENQLHLSIVLVDWTTESKKQRYGLCTRYLQNLNPTTPIDIECSIKDSAMALPDNLSTPLVVAGLGTGIAPFRSFVEERASQKRAGKAIGDIALYYGCRYEKTEYLYGNEWNDYLKEGVIKHLKPAFSRDQARKVYIQTKIDDEPEIIYDLLYKQNGSFFYCGQSGPVPGDIQKSIIRAIQKCGDLTEQQARDYIEKMEIDGRYIVESW